ncbi:uncharacterized protein LOC110440985, partial [Mizuhopecten yessoensis]
KKFRSEKLQKRWCVIHGGNFYYFNKCTDIRQKGCFSLKGYSFRKLGNLSFAIVCEGKRPYEFVAPSKDEAEKFRKAITGGKSPRKTLRKSDSYPGVEPAPPVSPTRDRSISIPTDKKSEQMPYKSKTRSHTPDPFQRSPNTHSQYRSNTLGSSDYGKTRTGSPNTQLQKTQSSPYCDRSTVHKQCPELPTRNKLDVDEYGYANVGVRKKGLLPVVVVENNENLMNQQQFSSSDDSDSDYDTVPESVPPFPAPRHKQVEKLLSISAQENKRSMALDRQKMPFPGLTSQSHESSDDDQDYDSPKDLPLRPESDYDLVGKFLRKPKESFDIGSTGDDDCYIDASKLDSVPNTNRQQRSNQPPRAPSKLGIQQLEDDIYFEPTSEFGHVEQISRSQIQNILCTDDENPYFIPSEESGHSKNDEPSYFKPNLDCDKSRFDEENPYFEPISDYDMPEVAVAGSFQTPKSKSPLGRTKSQENDGYIKVPGNTKMTSSRNSDGYSKPEEMVWLKRKPATAAATNKKSDLFTDDSVIYVNLPFAINKSSQMKQMEQQMELSSTINSKNTMKLQNSMEDSSYSDSDDEDYITI